jgi:hypothetical protein
MDNSEVAFERPGTEDGKTADQEKLIEQPYAQIGQLKMIFSKKN